MLSIYKKELKTYFSTMTGYAFVAFLSLVIGLVFYMINVDNANPYIGYSLNHAYVSIIFMVLVPVITMKIFADERHSKTDQMLFTAPITIEKIVVGKFLAVVTVFTLPVLAVLLYPLIMADYGDIPLGASYSAIIGFYLMGVAFFSIGVFVSSITENQVISAVVTFAILLFSFMLQYFTGVFSENAITSVVGICIIIAIVGIIYYFVIRNSVDKALIYAGVFTALGIAITILLYTIKSSLFDGLIQDIMLRLSLSNMYWHYFETEVIDLGSIVYFLSITAFFVFLTVQSIQKRRWS